MRSDIVPGATFPDYALPDHTGTVRTLSELQGQAVAHGGGVPSASARYTPGAYRGGFLLTHSRSSRQAVFSPSGAGRKQCAAAAARDSSHHRRRPGGPAPDWLRAAYST